MERERIVGRMERKGREKLAGMGGGGAEEKEIAWNHYSMRAKLERVLIMYAGAGKSHCKPSSQVW